MGLFLFFQLPLAKSFGKIEVPFIKLMIPTGLGRQQMRFKFTVMLLVALLCGTMRAQKPLAPAKEDNTSEWKEFSSAEGQFTVSLPGTSKEGVATVGTTGGPLKTHFFVLETEDRFLF